LGGDVAGYAVTQEVVGELDTNNFGWRLELGECEFKHVDRDDQIDAPGSSPPRACAVCACAAQY
jgi:hypothetical protein